MKIYTFYLFFLFLFASCSTTKWQNSLISNGDINDAIHNSITDFLNTSKIARKDSVFEIVTNNTENYIVISIAISGEKIYPRAENRPGTYDEIFPTRYVIKNNNLFYWNDPQTAINQDVISALDRYGLIDYHWTEEHIFPPYKINENQQSIVYFICKNNFNNYKKRQMTSKQSKIPHLNCK